MKEKPIVIGVAGGSGSGKSSVSQGILEHFPNESILVLCQDNYYKDQAHLSFDERLETNYDHPLAFENDLYIAHIQSLMEGQAVQVPIYDFAAYTRSDQVQLAQPCRVLILEGILIFDEPAIRDLCDIKIYVDTEDDIRLARRIKRDVIQRGRTFESVLKQYEEVVKPMHHQFIEPSKRYADIILPEGGQNQVAIDLLVTKVNTFLNKSF